MLAGVNTFPASSQLMLMSKRYMFLCMILHAFKLLMLMCITCPAFSRCLRGSFNSRAKRSWEHEHHVTSILNMIASLDT